MVASFLLFSSVRSLVASDMALSSLLTSAASSVTSSVSLALDASNASISACSVSTDSVFCLRVFSFVASSVSHQPLCSVSSLASSIRRTIKSWIIFFTFTKGSDPADTRSASAANTRLLSASALLFKSSAMRFREALVASARSETSAGVPSKSPSCERADGKCFSALPFTAPLEMISMALLIASNSSARNCCLAAKSLPFCSQVATKSSRYLESASLVDVVSLRSPLAVAWRCKALALASVFSSMSCLPCVICAVRSCMASSYA
mmetsp:Transcript_55215/g.143996  ORF Transcript_55215/g.143996 Transcript_55215/m.143996 type:complete len:264 (-) Transcript_55215:145-936(-)